MSQPRRQQIHTSKGSDMFLFGDDEHVRLSLIPTLIRIQCPLVFCSRRGIEVMERTGRHMSLCPLSTVPSRPMNRRRLCHRKTEIVVLYPVSLQTLNEVDILWNESVYRTNSDRIILLKDGKTPTGLNHTKTDTHQQFIDEPNAIECK